MSNIRYKDWFRQAVDDLKFAKDSLKLGHYNQTCFICQQAAEKALKALAFQGGAEFVKTHSVKKLAKSLNINGEIEKAGGVLDQFYISSRYPDGLPDGAPYEAFSLEQAKAAIEMADLIINTVSNDIKI